jgi:hypothetical protein
MYIVDLRTNLIHDAMNSKYECHIKDIPKDQIKKVYHRQTVERMCDSSHSPRYNGCEHCLSDLHQFDWTSIFH